jgi:DNA-binding CsgD family transcriptional regulator/tetratricopeptide (TPR) repeat protein
MNAGFAAPVMVGRSAQLATLRKVFGQVCEGSPAVVLLGGEAGAGKTRLITVFTDAIAGQAVLLSGGCVDLGGAGLAFAPYTAALRGLVRRLGAEKVAALVPGGVPAELGRLLPALGAPRPPGPGSGDAGTARARLFEELLGLLETLADQQPVVLVMEDAHWADQSSRELLAFLARNLQPATAVLIVVSYRTDDLEAGHPLRLLLAELERLPPVVRVELPRLSRREVIAQIRAILGGPGPAGLADQVAARADGNPMFVEVLLSSAGQLPESLRDLLLAGVRRLPEGTQRLLGAAAVAGGEFGEPLLEAVTEVGEEAVSEGLRPAVAAGVLVTGDDGYAFRHALIREAVQAGLLPGERRRWHARLARVLETRPPLAPGGRAAAQVAYHWHAAGESARALPAAWRAAAEAAEALAYAEQLIMLDRVLELWDAVPDAPGLAGASRLDVLEQAVTAAYLAGEPEHGMVLADAALAEPGIQADPVRSFFISDRHVAMSLQLRRPDLARLRQAAGAVPGDDPARPRVLAALAEQLMNAQLPEEACEQGERALAAARRARDPVAEASALVTVAALAARRGELAAQLPRLAEARAIAEQAGMTSLLLRALQLQASVLEAYGEHERSAQAARHGIAAATAAGLARTSGVVHAVNLAEALTALGRWNEALEVIEHARSLLPPAGVQLQLLRLAGSVALARGDFGAATAALAEARADAPASGQSFGTFEALMLAELQVSLMAAQGNTAAALAAAQRTLTAEGDRTARLKRFLWPLLAVTAEAACAATAPGSPEELTATARDVLRLAAGHASAAPPVSPVGRAFQAVYQAAVSQAAGQHTSGAWDDAASAWERLAEPYRRARALLHAAETALADGEDRDAVAARLHQAAGLADALGAGPLREQIASLAGRARIDIATGETRSKTSGQPPALPGLTGRELEVLRLVAAGRSNRDIAAELFISAKTASVHVSNILAKLGVHTRVEAAAIAHQAGITSTARDPGSA